MNTPWHVGASEKQAGIIAPFTHTVTRGKTNTKGEFDMTDWIKKELKTHCLDPREIREAQNEEQNKTDALELEVATLKLLIEAKNMSADIKALQAQLKESEPVLPEYSVSVNRARGIVGGDR